MKFWTFRRNVPKPKPGQIIDFKKGRGFFLRRKKPKPWVPASTVPKWRPPPILPVFSGKGLFTTSNSASAYGLGADWIAYQADPEGDQDVLVRDPETRAMFWMARPTQEIADKANSHRMPFIAQAESQPELERALGLHLTVPKALVGNPTAWTTEGFNQAAADDWILLLEFYVNAQPWLKSPDAHNYPYFANVVFGTYDASGEHPGVGGRVSLAEYRRMWPGAFSCWPAEGMTDQDRQVFKNA